MPKSERIGVGDLLEGVARAYLKYREGRRPVEERRFVAEQGEFVSQTERFIYEEDMSRYDESRAIEKPDHEFLGECGMEAFSPSKLETDKAWGIGVWLFDKNDIRTGTIVLVPDELSDKDLEKAYYLSMGGVFTAEKEVEIPPMIFSGLTMMVRVVEVEFGHDPKTDKQYFAKLVADVTISPSN